MILHYLTLQKITSEMQILIGMKIKEIFTQEKDSLLFLFEDDESEAYLEVSTDNKYSSIFMRNRFARANKNTVDLFEGVSGDVLQGVEIVNRDRIIKLSFINSDIYCLLFGRGGSNVIACNKEELIFDSFENKKELIGKKLSLPPKNQPPELEDPVLKDILLKREWFGKHYTEEYLKRYDSESHIDDFKNELLNSSEFFLYKKDHEYLFSMMRLSAFCEPEDIFDNASDGVRRKVILSKRDEAFNSEHKPIKKEIERLAKKSKANLKAYENYADSLVRAEEYRHHAELLMSQPDPKRISGKEIVVDDWSGEKVKIKLDEKLNLLDNANRLFDKARKSETEAEVKEKELPAIREKANKLDKALNGIEKVNTLKELAVFKNNYSEFLVRKMKEEEKGPEHKFRFYDIEGWEFYVGKNAKNNDELTMRFAKPNDLWFHARGVGGSHCVLRVPGKDKVPKNIIKRCAEIAAFYSQSKNAKYTPVAYCQKKYVRKPKGANPGSVTISKEEVVMVEPRN